MLMISSWLVVILLTIFLIMTGTLIYILYTLIRIRTTFDYYLEENRKEQQNLERILLRAKDDMLRALKEHNQEGIRKM
jgi:biopolymer transport protein ExbB/TolQ